MQTLETHIQNTILLPSQSSGNEFYMHDDSQPFKEVIFQSDSEEDYTDGKRLTSLVRELYLKRLREMLTKNYQSWCNHSLDPNKECSEFKGRKFSSSSDIEKCVKYLEQSALRSCMIASLYQKSMVNLINVIKQRTIEHNLFESLEKLEKVNVFCCDQCIQTEVENTCDKACQTDATSGIHNKVTEQKRQVRSTASLLDLPLPDPKDVLLSLESDFIDKSNLKMPVKHHLKETVAKVHPLPRKPCVDDFKSSCDSKINGFIDNEMKNVTDSEGFSRESKRRKLDNDLYVGNLLSIVPEDSNSNQIFSNSNLIDILTGSDLNSISCNNSSDSFNTDKKPRTGERSGGMSKVNYVEPLKQDDLQLSLDDRLAELGIATNDESNVSSTNSKTTNVIPPFKTTHRRTWHMEMAANYCNFAQLFLSLSGPMQELVTSKLDDLFGCFDEEDYNIALSPELISVCRKRTANMVVAELTPYFDAKKIANKFLFKEFAKRVTNSILSRTYAPDSAAVNQFVCEYFNEHNSVMSLKDLDF